MGKFTNHTNKLLIASNEPLSNSTSNGRTLRNLLLDIPKEQIAQFYIHGTPDLSVCSTLYSVTDRDALNAFLLKIFIAKMLTGFRICVVLFLQKLQIVLQVVDPFWYMQEPPDNKKRNPHNYVSIKFQ